MTGLKNNTSPIALSAYLIISHVKSFLLALNTHHNKKKIMWIGINHKARFQFPIPALSFQKSIFQHQSVTSSEVSNAVNSWRVGGANQLTSYKFHRTTCAYIGHRWNSHVMRCGDTWQLHKNFRYLPRRENGFKECRLRFSRAEKGSYDKGGKQKKWTGYANYSYGCWEKKVSSFGSLCKTFWFMLTCSPGLFLFIC